MTEPSFLDWREHTHWGKWPKPCRLCGRPTNLLDDVRLPAHKVCAEAALQPRQGATN